MIMYTYRTITNACLYMEARNLHFINFHTVARFEMLLI